MTNQGRRNIVMNINGFFDNNTPPKTVILNAELGRSYREQTIALHNQSQETEDIVTAKLVNLKPMAGQGQDAFRPLDIIGSIVLIKLLGDRLGIYYDIKPSKENKQNVLEKFVNKPVKLILEHTHTDFDTKIMIKRNIEIEEIMLKSQIDPFYSDGRVTNKLGEPTIVMPSFKESTPSEPLSITGEEASVAVAD